MTETDKTYAGGLLHPQLDPYETYCLSIDSYHTNDNPTAVFRLAHGLATQVDPKGWVSKVPGRDHAVGSLVFLEQTKRTEREGQVDLKEKWLTHVGWCVERLAEGDEERLLFKLYKLDEEVPSAAIHAAKPAATPRGLARSAIVTGTTVTFLKTNRKADLGVLAPHAAATARQLVAAYAPPDLVAAYWSKGEQQALAAARDWNGRHRKFVEEHLDALEAARAARTAGIVREDD